MPVSFWATEEEGASDEIFLLFARWTCASEDAILAVVMERAWRGSQDGCRCESREMFAISQIFAVCDWLPDCACHVPACSIHFENQNTLQAKKDFFFKKKKITSC